MLKKIFASMFFVLFALPVNAEPADRLIVTAKISPVQAESIQEMIDSAKEGERVVVPPGTYKEDIIIDKFVKLEGEGVTLEGTVAITGHNASFSNFTLTNYGVENDGDPVVLVSGNNVSVIDNTFDKTEDAFEIVVKGDRDTIKGNTFNGIISTDSGFMKVEGEANNVEIRNNRFLGNSTTQWGPLQLFPSEESKITVFGNEFKNAEDIAIFVGGTGGYINFRQNQFSGVGTILIANTPNSLNQMNDFQKAEVLIEKLNPGSDVIFGRE